jgi:Alkylmercury lyase
MAQLTTIDPVSQSADAVPVAARAAGRLSYPARALHQYVLAAFTSTGKPPASLEISRELRTLANLHRAEPDQVLAELSAADLLAFAADGQIRAAYPFSPTPTAIQVNCEGGPHAYAMCAIDALGMSAMIGRPVTITAEEPGTARPITVSVNVDHAVWTPRGTVVFAGSSGQRGRPSVDRCCGHINFFTNARAARAWAGKHPEITGTILRQRGALRLAIEEFGAMLQPAANAAAAR